jgi:hypothetical protein
MAFKLVGSAGDAFFVTRLSCLWSELLLNFIGIIISCFCFMVLSKSGS